MKLKIDWANEQTARKTGFFLRRFVKKAIRAALEEEAFPCDAMVSVTFTDDRGIREKNREFRGIDKPTDVLSVPIYDMKNGDRPQPGEIAELGDIVLSLETAARQGEEYGHGFARECAFLVVHSVLHLLGYDHMEDEEEREMRARQRVIMKELGLDIKNEEKTEEEA